jgi:hypothetical protein
VADAAACFAAPVIEGMAQEEVEQRRVEAVPENLRHRVAPGGSGLPGVAVVVQKKRSREGVKRVEVLGFVLHDLKGPLFLELMEMIR